MLQVSNMATKEGEKIVSDSVWNFILSLYFCSE